MRHVPMLLMAANRLGSCTGPRPLLSCSTRHKDNQIKFNHHSFDTIHTVVNAARRPQGKMHRLTGVAILVRVEL